MSADWERFARYTVYRTEGCKKYGDRVQTILHTSLTWAAAREKQAEAERLLALEPGYEPDVMGRPLISLLLENKEATNRAYLEFRNQRSGDESATSPPVNDDADGCALG